VSTRLQPDGARLDEQGQRLWRWMGTGALEEFYSVTTMIGGGVPKHLQAWYAKLVAELAYADVERYGAGALDQWAIEGRRYLDELRESGMKLEKADETPKGLALRWLKGEPERVRDTAAEKGTDVHDATEEFVLQHAREGARIYAATGMIPVWPDDIAPHMGGFVRFLNDYRPIYLATEARIYNRTRSYAGKGDAFLMVKVPADWEPPAWISRPFVHEREGGEPDWLSLCTDYKSGRALYHEVALQTSAYSNGEFVGAPDGMTELPVPRVDGTAVLHLKANGQYRFELLRSDEYVFRVFLFAREIFAWVNREGRAGTRTWLGGPVPTDLADALAASLEAVEVA
jgi:hypothetical protein